MRHNRYRRRFLQAGAAASGLVLAACGGSSTGTPAVPVAGNNAPPAPADSTPAPSRAPQMKQGTLLTGGSQVNPTTGEKRWVFSQLNLDKGLELFGQGEREPAAMLAWARQSARLIVDIGFLAHGVVPNPLRSERVLVFEKKGDGACEIDLASNRLVTRIPPAPKHEFYGHGGYSADGKLVYATEYDAETYVGRMTVRDASDFKIVGDFPTYGEWPHDCQFIDGGRTVAITNGGGHLQGGSKPNVCYVEVAGGKLLEKIEFENPNINAGHLFINPAGDLAVLHAMREGLHTTEALGGLSLRPKAGRIRQMTEPAEIAAAMKGETLSVAWNPADGIIGVTNPYGNLVSFWNLSRQQFVNRRRIPQPRGIALTLDRAYYVITFDRENPTLLLLPAATREVEPRGIQFPLACDGSHAYVYDYAV